MPARVFLGVGRWATGLMPIVFLGHVTLGSIQPGNACSWLTPAQLQKTLGQPFDAPQQGSAEPAFQGQTVGTQCEYKSRSGMDVLLIAYTDRSADEAKTTFGTLAAAYTATAKPGGVGDDAYVDKQHAIHVLKGKVRYYIAVATGVTGGDKQALAIELAKVVAAQLGG
jgi:hypothetical protein